MYTNDSCVLYLKSQNYVPITIPHCFITDTKIASMSKEGMNYTERIQCLFVGYKELVFTEAKDFIIRGTTSPAFDNSSERKTSESIKILKDAGALTIMMADRKEYGSHKMRHWELSCA